jgi:hypothetical protein
VVKQLQQSINKSKNAQKVVLKALGSCAPRTGQHYEGSSKIKINSNIIIPWRSKPVTQLSN